MMTRFLIVFFMAASALCGAGQDKIEKEFPFPAETEKWSVEAPKNMQPPTLAEKEIDFKGQKVKALEVTLKPRQGLATLRWVFRPVFDLRGWTHFEMDFKHDSEKGLAGDFIISESNWKGYLSRPFTKSATIFWGQESMVDKIGLKKDIFHHAAVDANSMRSSLKTALTNMFRIRFKTDELEKETKVLIVNPRFVVRRDDLSELNARFENYIRNYRPDYSDSSKYMLPPEKNRLNVPVALVKDGKAVGSIAFRTEDGVVAKTAAAELQKWIREITGVTVPFASKFDDGTIQLAAGKEAFQGSFADAFARLDGRDGYAIRSKDGRVMIFGAQPKGVMNGVFALLENNSDIIWSRPHAKIGTVFSRKPSFSVIWGDNVLSHPASRDRGWNGYRDMEWMARNQCNLFNGGGGGDISYMNPRKIAYGYSTIRHCYGHNIGHFVYNKKYFSDHPEYYSLIDYKDKTTKKTVRGRKPWNQYCFTNPEMKKVFISNALEMLRKAPRETQSLTVDMDDTLNSCLCDECTAPIRLPNGETVDMDDADYRSTQYFIFLNDVMKAVNSEFPKMQIKTLAYFWTLIPPRCEVDQNIRAEFAYYPRSNDKRPLFAPENSRALRYLQGWSKKVRYIDVYNYHGLGLEFPRPISEVNAWDFKLFNRYTQGPSSEYRHNGDFDGKGGQAGIWDYSAIEMWVQTRLYWDPDRDVEQLRKYYIRRTYREAAPEIEKFFGAFRADFLQQPNRSGIGASGAGITEAYILAVPGREESMRANLEAAEKLTAHPASLEHIRRLRAVFEKYVSQAKEKAAKKKLKTEKKEQGKNKTTAGMKVESLPGGKFGANVLISFEPGGTGLQVAASGSAS